jgi:hypothetical protein
MTSNGRLYGLLKMIRWVGLQPQCSMLWEFTPTARLLMPLNNTPRILKDNYELKKLAKKIRNHKKKEAQSNLGECGLVIHPQKSIKTVLQCARTVFSYLFKMAAEAIKPIASIIIASIGGCTNNSTPKKPNKTNKTTNTFIILLLILN